ncbi:hypothetical protein NDU88_005763 [Pleurodeles waltl]|uniref:Uncharacterized protein n=1 Tax=Pleurodeles waltl TaxID=8319 RepID=A0AAV7QJV1_PLEWA|nr:hypothetical protein NDU88_005763 [Pleurodeles waltl]
MWKPTFSSAGRKERSECPEPKDAQDITKPATSADVGRHVVSELLPSIDGCQVEAPRLYFFSKGAVGRSIEPSADVDHFVEGIVDDAFDVSFGEQLQGQLVDEALKMSSAEVLEIEVSKRSR